MRTAQAKAQLPGISRVIREINAQIPEIAQRPNDLVFLTGEPGTERALVARLIHQTSERSEKKFVRMMANWKLPPDFSSQIESADGGTVFISLVREFPVDMQYTLMELALDRSFTDPLSGETREADVRLILTTTLEMEALFDRSPLLPDLREILVRAHIDLPALRERREDIPALVRFALQRAQETGQSHAEAVDRQVLALFRAYPWPGNAEQLLLVAAQAALKATGPVVSVDDLPEDFVFQLPSNIVRLARSIEQSPVPPESTSSEEAGEEKVTGLSGETEEEEGPSAGDFVLVEGSDEFPAPASTEEESTSEAGVVEIVNETAEDADAGEPPTSEAEGESLAESAEAKEEEEAEKTQQILSIASRLYAQSALLARQMAGPLPPATETAREIAAARGSQPQLSPSLEGELTRGLEQILALRRQLAILNRREQDSAFTIRDLFQRLELVSDHSESSDAQVLPSQLAEIDAIIERITARLPKISEDIQESIRRILGKKRHD